MKKFCCMIIFWLSASALTFADAPPVETAPCDSSIDICPSAVMAQAPLLTEALANYQIFDIDNPEEFVNLLATDAERAVSPVRMWRTGTNVVKFELYPNAMRGTTDSSAYDEALTGTITGWHVVDDGERVEFSARLSRPIVGKMVKLHLADVAGAIKVSQVSGNLVVDLQFAGPAVDVGYLPARPFRHELALNADGSTCETDQICRCCGGASGEWCSADDCDNNADCNRQGESGNHGGGKCRYVAVVGVGGVWRTLVPLALLLTPLAVWLRRCRCPTSLT